MASLSFVIGVTRKGGGASLFYIGAAYFFLFWPCFAIVSKDRWIKAYGHEIVYKDSFKTIYKVDKCWHMGCYFDEETVEVTTKEGVIQ